MWKCQTWKLCHVLGRFPNSFSCFGNRRDTEMKAADWMPNAMNLFLSWEKIKRMMKKFSPLSEKWMVEMSNLYFFVFILDIKMGEESVLHSSVSVLLKLLFSHFECLPVFYPEAALPVCQSFGITLFSLFISFKEMQILLFIWNRCARSHAGLCVQLFVSKIICTRIKGGGGSGLRSFRTNSRALFLQWS